MMGSMIIENKLHLYIILIYFSFIVIHFQYSHCKMTLIKLFLSNCFLSRWRSSMFLSEYFRHRHFTYAHCFVLCYLVNKWRGKVQPFCDAFFGWFRKMSVTVARKNKCVDSVGDFYYNSTWFFFSSHSWECYSNDSSLENLGCIENHWIR